MLCKNIAPVMGEWRAKVRVQVWVLFTVGSQCLLWGISLCRYLATSQNKFISDKWINE